MSSNLSSDTSKAQTMIDPFTVFKFQWDSTQNITTTDTNIPTVIGRFVNTGITALTGSAAYLNTIPIQYQKLQYYFRMYEEFTILEDRVDYAPMFTSFDINAFQIVNWAEPKTTKTAEWALRNTIMLNTTTTTLIADKNDHQIVSDVDTYYQLRARPEARTFRMNQPWSFASRPTVNDLRIIANPDNTNFSAANNPFIPNTMSGVTGTGSWAEWGPPEKLGWLPTKVMNPSAQWVLNYTPTYYGYKQYFYFPIGPAPGMPTSVDYGVTTHTLTFAFRKADYRPLYNLTNALLRGTEEQLENVLDDTTGRRMITEDFTQPAFKKVKTDVEAEQDRVRSQVAAPESL